jgi:5-(carboxyamino)imidazole ribonucleotide mutase
MVAAKTTLPVIGVPVQTRALNGLDSLLSIVQMPGGVPVATVAIGTAGATNAGLLAAQILGAFDEEIAIKLDEKREKTKQTVLESSDELV